MVDGGDRNLGPVPAGSFVFGANYRKLPQIGANLVQISATPVQFFALQVQLGAIPVQLGAIPVQLGATHLAFAGGLAAVDTRPIAPCEALAKWWSTMM